MDLQLQYLKLFLDNWDILNLKKYMHQKKYLKIKHTCILNKPYLQQHHQPETKNIQHEINILCHKLFILCHSFLLLYKKFSQNDLLFFSIYFGFASFFAQFFNSYR